MMFDWEITGGCHWRRLVNNIEVANPNFGEAKCGKN